jgi:peptide/nickel transport system permease protein
MLSFISRRIVTSIFVLLGASFIIYLLIAYSGDPLAQIKASNSPAKEEQLRQRTEMLNLNVPPALRYFIWLGGASKCFIGQCDLGRTIQNQPVTQALAEAVPATLRLLTGATIIAIVVGISIGVITALRQYSVLDYSMTFVSFLFFSLPVFWVAVLLKQYGAIGFNDFLATSVIPPDVIVVLSLVSGVVWAVIISGSWRRRWITFGSAAVASALVMIYLSAVKWFQRPELGPVVILVFGVAFAYGATVLFAGLRNRRALYSSLICTAIGFVCYFVLQGLLDVSTLPTLIILGVVSLVVAGVVGYLMGGYDRSQSIRAAMLTAFGMDLLIVVDRFMQSWPDYTSNSLVNNRPIPTIGAKVPQLTGDFWMTSTDTITHLILPTISIVLISLASYSRYSRASMLEVMGQDYVRTARAKGLSERVVITRHAFRNALIPLATIVAFDIGSLIGGAVITENVFSYQGMGQLFLQGITNVDPNPVMAVAVITGITAVTFNLLADLAYSALDPRVRVKS